MNNNEIYDRLMQAAESDIKNWQKCDKLTQIEQVIKYNPVVSGIARAALYLLPTDDYFKFTQELREKGAWF